MAYWFKKKSGAVYVCYMKDGKPVPMKRAQTERLDGLSDRELDDAVVSLAAQYERAKVTPDNIVWADRLKEQVEQFLAYLRSERKDASTVKEYERHLRRNVIPFFLAGDKPLHNPTHWPGRSIQMLDWLQKKGATPGQISRSNITVRAFYKYLCDWNQIQTGIDIRLREPVLEEDEEEAEERTPLRVFLNPQQMLHRIRWTGDESVKLMMLCGYFLSLRPQEVFALKPTDFTVGTGALAFECSMAAARHGLYGRLLVNVRRQLSAGKGKRTKKPKAHSAGLVACFDKEAAGLLVALLRARPADEPLFSFGARHLYRGWERGGLVGVTMKDLRRASIYWLGHNTGLEIGNLMKHARHKYLSTTQLYMRRPGETVVAAGETNWDLEA